MACQRRDQNDEVVEKYLRDELDSAAQEDFEIHVLDCSDCLQELEILQAVAKELGQREREIRNPDFGSKHLQWRWIMAVSTVLVVACLVAFQHKLKAPKKISSVKRDLPIAQTTPESKTSTGHERDTPSKGESPTFSEWYTPLEGVSPTFSVGNEHAPERSKNEHALSPNGPKSRSKHKQNASRPGRDEPMEQNPVQTPSDSVPDSPPKDAVTAEIGHDLPRTADENTSNAGEESAQELFRLGLVQPPPYTFAGLASSAQDVTSGNLDNAHEQGLGAAISTGKPRDSQLAAQGRTYFQNAMGAYVEKRYAKAVALLEADLDLEPNAPDTNYYLGICLLVQGDPAGAIAPLRTVAGNNRSSLAKPAHFYLAKAYIQTGDLAKAAAEFQITAAGTGRLGSEARALLKRLQVVRGMP